MTKKDCACITNTNQLTFSENNPFFYTQTHRVCTLQCLEAEVCGARTYIFCETRDGLLSVEHHCSYSNCLYFGTGVLHLIPINHQPDATVFQFIILTFVYSSTIFGRFSAHHRELIDCSGSLWFYLRIVVTVVLCSWSGRPARPRTQHDYYHDMKVKPEAATAVIELLMMGGKTPETR
jgi:hypothetical protein